LELNEIKNKLRFLEKENKGYKRDNNQLQHDREKFAREKNEATNDKNITKAGVNALTREIEYLRKQTEMEKNNIISLIKDRDKMQTNISKAEETNQSNKDEIIAKKNEIE